MRSVQAVGLAILMASLIAGCQPDPSAGIKLPEPGGYVRLVNATEHEASYVYSGQPALIVPAGQASVFQIGSTKPKPISVTVNGQTVELNDQAPKSKQNMSVCLVPEGDGYALKPVFGEVRDPEAGLTELFVYNLTDQADLQIALNDKAADAAPGTLASIPDLAFTEGTIKVAGQELEFKPEEKQTYTVYIMPGKDKPNAIVVPNKEIIKVTGIGGGMTP